jgi:hypothetical protein|tara:strand:+ start:814 stop:1161 length:348 start_codon:yes stop_codon:yes gene_type:complete
MGYQVDPNDSTKQIPRALPRSAFMSAKTPSVGTLTDRPNHIVIAKDSGGDVGFYFEPSASFAAAATTEGGTTLTGSANYTNFGTITETGQELNIQPTAWSGSSGASVVFIYRGGL